MYTYVQNNMCFSWSCVAHGHQFLILPLYRGSSSTLPYDLESWSDIEIAAAGSCSTSTLPLCTIIHQSCQSERLLPIINLCRVRNTISTATDINRSTPSPWNWMYCTCLWRQPRLHTPRTPSPRLPTVGQDFVIVIITASALVHPSQPLPSPPTPNSSPSVFWSLGKIMTSVNRPIVIVSLRSMYGLAEIHQSSLLVAKVSIR